MKVGAKIFRWFGIPRRAGTRYREWMARAFDGYVDKEPSTQNAVDLIPGWNHALPPEVGAEAGRGTFYYDTRIVWCLAQFGSIEGRRILELGPLEGSHTYMLDQQSPAVLHAIEANKLAFVRCLITKELLNFKHARFFLGNFVPWLERGDNSYDLILASGVLYHMADPVRVLELIARRTNAVFLWTHYFSESEMPPGDLRRTAFPGDVKVIDFQGHPVRLHRRSYHGAAKNTNFCGGMHDTHYWLERDDILMILENLGFDDIRTADEEPQHEFGPAFSVFARRIPGAATNDSASAENIEEYRK